MYAGWKIARNRTTTWVINSFFFCFVFPSRPNVMWKCLWVILKLRPCRWYCSHVPPPLYPLWRVRRDFSWFFFHSREKKKKIIINLATEDVNREIFNKKSDKEIKNRLYLGAYNSAERRIYARGFPEVTWKLLFSYFFFFFWPEQVYSYRFRKRFLSPEFKHQDTRVWFTTRLNTVW